MTEAEGEGESDGGIRALNPSVRRFGMGADCRDIRIQISTGRPYIRTETA